VSAALLLGVSLLVVMLLTAAATAVRSVSRIWLRPWVEQGSAGSEAALVYLERPQRLLLAAGTAVALTAAVTGLLLGALPADSAWWRAGRVVGAALLLLVVGQLLPRAVARRWAVRLFPLVVPVLRAVDLVLGPLAAAVRSAAGRGDATPGAAESRDALEDLLREGALEGVSAGDEAAIISGVVQFGDKRAADVMRPRDEIFAVDASLPREALMEQVAQAGYSRVPVYDGSLDAMVGMMHVFDLI
jgi:putative hemolysin